MEGARENNKVLELNNHSLTPGCFRQGARENDTIMLEYCREYKVPVLVSSDAHFDTHIREFDHAVALLEELKFPEELILNRSVEMLDGHINRRIF